MKTVELSEAARARRAAAAHLTPGQLIAGWLGPEEEAAGFAGWLEGPAGAAALPPADRYLALLAWCARNHAADFAAFIAGQESGRRYLAWTRDEINGARARHQARQIDGTMFWAVLALDEATRRQFVRRLLEFVGYPDELVQRADRALGPWPATHARSA